jgi:hypothetical protein
MKKSNIKIKKHSSELNIFNINRSFGECTICCRKLTITDIMHKSRNVVITGIDICLNCRNTPYCDLMYKNNK